VHGQQYLLILWALSACGVLAAGSIDLGTQSSAVSRITMTIMPRVEVDKYPQQLAAAGSETLCLSSNGATDFFITVEGHSDVALDRLSSADGSCLESGSIAFGLQMPSDSSEFGDQLTLIVSAE
jgi:hypothetical protein